MFGLWAGRNWGRYTVYGLRILRSSALQALYRMEHKGSNKKHSLQGFS